ncbi:MAG: penicillin acylase family protein [Gemmatimonadota bacterium]|nr:penicillin acylase family protein [Gemmatimonadota bacterium]
MSGGRAGAWLAAATLTLRAGASLLRPGPLPRLGPLLDPVRGIWSVAREAELPARATGIIPGLTAPVTVRYDDRAVPHIFAATELDATRALGYVVARDRLFQLELSWRAGAGRLTELLGARALPMDQESRRLGLPDAAARRLADLPPDSPERRALEALSDGINARIAAAGSRHPFEYQVLGVAPARWEPVNSLHLLGRMGWILASSDLEENHAAAARLVGDAAADALYPRESPIQEPIQPNGQAAPRHDRTPLPPPGGGSTRAARRGTMERDAPLEADAVGSNNWAVAPGRTAAGHALLAGDPHLELSLPSVWYEAHLITADGLDVYGVTLPGAPGMVIGFTRDLAWSLTNTEADVYDRYAETVDDPAHPARYRVDGTWRDLRLAVEQYLDPAGRVVHTDTLRYSHRGPLLQARGGGWESHRWTMLEPAGRLTLFGRAARAATATAWLDSMVEHRAPAQNMLVADRHGTIAIRSTGRFPVRPSGRGDLLQRGDSSGADWSRDWSPEELPQAIAPAQGFLASANQQPIDPAVEPRYLGANWYSPWRAIRINQLLRADSAVTPDAMRRYQTDPGSPAADLFVPALLAAAARFPERDSVGRAARLLAEWDRRYTRENTRAVLYEAAMRALGDRLWDELDPARADGAVATPGWAVTARLLADPANPWWDVRATTGVREDRDRILADALAAGLQAVIARHGAPDAGGWRWDRVRHANIYHMLRLPGLSALRVPVQGGQSTLNPSSGSGSFGPSWRMVVELGPEVRGWGTYPGGQSGNPASSRYADRIGQWSNGELDTLLLPRTPDGLGAHAGPVLELEPAP